MDASLADSRAGQSNVCQTPAPLLILKWEEDNLTEYTIGILIFWAAQRISLSGFCWMDSERPEYDFYQRWDSPLPLTVAADSEKWKKMRRDLSEKKGGLLKMKTSVRWRATHRRTAEPWCWSSSPGSHTSGNHNESQPDPWLIVDIFDSHWCAASRKKKLLGTTHPSL